MAFQSYIDPIEALVSRYFDKRRTMEDNQPQSGGELLEPAASPLQDTLPESPCRLLRDEEGRVYKCIYGDFESLTPEGEQDPHLEFDGIIWQEEILRDDSGKTTAVEITYPDGSVSRDSLIRENGKVTGVN